MEQNFYTNPNPGPENQPKSDRSLLYMGIVLGLVILILGYLTFLLMMQQVFFLVKKKQSWLL